MSDNESRTPFSLHARSRSFFFAFRGIAYLARSEHNAWIHLAASVAAIALGGSLKISANDWRWIALAITLVWLAEALNTAIERLCDVVNPNFDQRIGHAKDVAAGGVLIAAIGAAAIGAVTFLPYL
ncbi:Diacylglycerol kinase [Sphingomonas antarctica]|uniref:diacylglycerol kinase family protein n=1 Tax=Sphingomonas antarctica TaxID=2040274 RepID=UPI0039EC8FCE